MNPVSLPAAPAQPEQQFYGLAQLNLFQVYDRASFLAAFGVQPPTYDPTKASKAWFDSTQNASDTTTVVNYGYYAGTARIVMSMTAAEAATVNIAGVETYPVYTIDPTEATQGGAVINPQQLSTLAQAQAMAVALGLPAAAVVDASQSGPFATVYPATELRRLYALPFKGVLNFVGDLLKEQNTAGVGAAGSWDLSGTTPVWNSSQPTQDPPLNSETRITPQRGLLANEEVVQTNNLQFMVERTDLGPAAPASSSAASLTSDQAAAIADIPAMSARIAALAKIYGIPAILLCLGIFLPSSLTGQVVVTYSQQPGQTFQAVEGASLKNVAMYSAAVCNYGAAPAAPVSGGTVRQGAELVAHLNVVDAVLAPPTAQRAQSKSKLSRAVTVLKYVSMGVAFGATLHTGAPAVLVQIGATVSGGLQLYETYLNGQQAAAAQVAAGASQVMLDVNAQYQAPPGGCAPSRLFFAGQVDKFSPIGVSLSSGPNPFTVVADEAPVRADIVARIMAAHEAGNRAVAVAAE